MGSGDQRNSDRDLSYENLDEFTVVESYPRTTHKVFAVVLHLRRHEVSEVNHKTFAKTTAFKNLLGEDV